MRIVFSQMMTHFLKYLLREKKMVKQQLVNPLVFKNSLNMQMQCIACKRKNSFKSENFNRASVTDGQKRIGFS